MGDKVVDEIRKEYRAKIGVIEIRGQRYKLASLGRRWLGAWLDLMISCFTVGTGIILGHGLVAFIVLVTGRSIDELNVIGIALLMYPVILAYPLFRDGLPGGGSLGKRVLRMRVIDERTGSPCTYGHSFARNMFGILVSLIPPFFIDVVFMLGRKNQRLGDKAAHTLVVMREEEK